MGDDEIEYLSTTERSIKSENVNINDERDLPALKQIQLILKNNIDFYNTIHSLDISESEFKVKQQLAVNSKVRSGLVEVKELVDEVIERIKEKYE